MRPRRQFVMDQLLDFLELQHALANQKPFTMINTDDPNTWGKFTPEENNDEPKEF